METSQPLISFCIPSYNSAPFLHYAVDSLLPFGGRIEILIIDDGSKDATGVIADDYAKKNPGFIRAFHQPNGGHGEGINHGLAEARGLYFKVLDSDDWADEESLRMLLSDISSSGTFPDLYLTDYQYWHGRERKGELITYAYLFPDGKRECGWDELRSFRYSSNITIHSAMFKTSVLRASGLHCPAHVSYEDNYFVYCPLPFVQTIRYVPRPLYQYLLGREGQSMENDNCIRKYHDYIIDGELIFDSHDILSFKKSSKGLYRAMKHHLFLNMSMVPTFAKLNGSEQARKDLALFYGHLRQSNPRQYRMVKRHPVMRLLNLPGVLGRIAVKESYRLAHRIVQFN